MGLAYGVSVFDNPKKHFPLRNRGSIFSFGYQRKISPRLRINPMFSMGSYSSEYNPPSRDSYFNSFSLQSVLNFDAIKYISVALVLSCGGLLTNHRGLVGTGGVYRITDNTSPSSTNESMYFSEFHVGGMLGGGFRISNPENKISISIMPVNIYVGTNYLFEYNAQISLSYDLD